jgi:hypothetical protein
LPHDGRRENIPERKKLIAHEDPEKQRHPFDDPSPILEHMHG